MLTRRFALPLAALTAFATLPVLAAAAPAGAATQPSPLARGGGDNGDPDGPAANNQEPKDNCPTELWTVPLEVKGLACILLLPKPEKQGAEGEEAAGGGLGDLLG
jgi:hypothetical protein